MTDFETILQERLEKLEAGEPLHDCLADLPQDEADALQLAANLRQLSLPVATAETAVVQRAALLRLAQDGRLAPATSSPWAALLGWLRARPTIEKFGLAVALPAVGLLLLALGFALVAPPQAAPGVAEDAAPLVADGSDGETAVPVAGDRAGEETDAVVESPTAGAYTVYAPAMAAAVPQNPQTAVVQALNGVVEVQTADGSWTAVANQAALTSGQRLRTGKLSGATLSFYDGSQAKLGANAELSLDELNAQLPAAGFRTVVMTQWRGESTHEVAIRHDGGSRYEVKNPNGTGIARGTVFQVTVDANEMARYVVLEGQVDVTAVDTTVSVFAGQVSLVAAAEPPTPPHFWVTGEGAVSQMGDAWIIGGQPFQTSADTVIVGDPQLGDWVQVSGHLLADGSRLADTIVLLQTAVADPFTLTGAVSAISAAGWTVAGQTIAVAADTAIDADIVVGDTVQVSGTLAADGTLHATAIVRLPAVAAGTPFHFTGVVSALLEGVWTISGQAVNVTAVADIDQAIAVGSLVTVQGLILPDGVWQASQMALQPDAEQGTFAFTGDVQSKSPWQVANISFETRVWTAVAADITVGDTVTVRGIILDDGTWIASEILKTSPDDTTLTFIGAVTNLEPLTVNGIVLTLGAGVTPPDGLAVGDTVMVTVALLPDGTWLVRQISALEDEAVQGCFTISAVVVRVEGNQLVLADWPTVTLPNDVTLDGDITPNSVVVMQVCVDADGNVIVVTIVVVIHQDVDDVDEDDSDDNDEQTDSQPQERVTICHKGRQTMTLPQSALNGHLGHGDTLGPCN